MKNSTSLRIIVIFLILLFPTIAGNNQVMVWAQAASLSANDLNSPPQSEAALKGESPLRQKNLLPTYDIAPPTNLTGFTIDAFHTANTPAVMDISWNTAEDNVGVAGYVLQRSINSDFTDPTTYNLDLAVSYRDKTVRPATTYYWRIKALDTSGNLSSEWTNLAAATLAAPVVNKQFTIEGDSASVGYGLPGYIEGPPEIYSIEHWGNKLRDLLDGTWTVRTVAKGGDRILGDIPNDRAREITSFRQPSYERDIVLLWAGSNDIYGLPSRGIYPTEPIPVYNAMKTYVDAAQADGFEVWIMDAYPRSAFGFPDKDAERIIFNNLLRADNSFADKFIDIDAWPEFKSRLNETYYQTDQTHMTKAGNQLVADRIFAELATAPLTISTASPLRPGKTGAAYSQTITSAGGSGKRTVSLVTGNLPAGISLLNDRLQGKPSAKGVYIFTLEVKDSLGTSVNREYNLTIAG